MEIINLNLIPGKAWPVAHATQFDKGREFRANLFEGSQVYTLAGDETVDAIIKKPDGNQVIETLVNTADNYVIVTTTEQMTAVAGPSLGEIRITKNDTVIGSLKFILECEQSADTGIASHSEINNLETQVAAIVADQYDADNVVFDAAPTAGHGVGFAVTSEGVLNAIPDELNDLSDVDINSAAVGEALVWNGAEWVNGTPDLDVDDLADVTITTPSDDDILVYQNGEWVNMANPASTANFADAYDPTATYNTGDVCIYNNVLYICTDDNTTGDFDPSKWTATTIDNVIGSLSTLTTTDKSSIVGAVNEVNNSLTYYSTSTVTDIFATYQGTMISDVVVTQTHKVTSMVLRGTVPAGIWQTIGTVKDRFKNSVPNQFFAVIDTTANYVGMMYLGTDGTVNFFLHGTGNKNVDFGFTYIAQ